MQSYTKPILWIASSLVLATSVFGQEAVETSEAQVAQGEEICKGAEPVICNGNGQPLCPPLQPTCQPYVYKPPKCGNVQEGQVPSVAAFNAPAEINTGILGDWNFFTTVSFLYWQPTQDNFEIASLGSQSVGSLNNPRTIDTRQIQEMDFDFKAAFKVCTGMNFHNDDWNGYVEYTRFRGTDSMSASTLSTNPTLYNLWGTTAVASGLYGTSVFNSVSAEFDCKLDFIDAELERVYYVGQRLAFHTALGLRYALINESLSANYAYNGSYINNTSARVIALPGVFNAIYRTNSWGIGPRIGLEMDWMLRNGFRVVGSGFADVLYTSYEVQTKNSTVPFTGDLFLVGNPITVSTHEDDLGLLRAHLDFEIGAGWGKYLDYNNIHVDFAATYGFQVFFNQNVMRLASFSPSNLYVQGLTFTARLDY